MKKTLCLLLFLISTAIFAKKPAWVRMMHSEDVNYFKAIKRYERYWEHHYIPNEEEEHENAGKLQEDPRHDPRRFLVRVFQSKEKGKEISENLHIEYKGFKKWKMEMLPYVKSNGRIMTAEERVAAWNQLKNM